MDDWVTPTFMGHTNPILYLITVTDLTEWMTEDAKLSFICNYSIIGSQAPGYYCSISSLSDNLSCTPGKKKEVTI